MNELPKDPVGPLCRDCMHPISESVKWERLGYFCGGIVTGLVIAWLLIFVWM